MRFSIFSHLMVSRLLLLGLTLCVQLRAWEDLPHLLVVRPDNEHFYMAMEGIAQEIGSDFKISELLLTRQIQVGDLVEEIQTVQPKLLILMDNRATGLYRRYQESLAQGSEPVPALILLSIMLSQDMYNLPHATGIEYEFQGITVFTHLRATINNPVNKVGIIYRSTFKNFFEEQRSVCAKEKIELIGYEISNDREAYKKQIKKGIKYLKGQKIEALWITNDSLLITSELLADAWLPALHHSNYPAVVGLARFVQDSIPLGQFAVVPDHTALGQQAAGMILEIQAANWSVNDFKLRAPRSAQKILNLKNLPSNIQVNHTVITELDQVIR